MKQTAKEKDGYRMARPGETTCSQCLYGHIVHTEKKRRAYCALTRYSVAFQGTCKRAMKATGRKN